MGRKPLLALNWKRGHVTLPSLTSRPFASTLTLSLVLLKYERSNKRFETFNVTRRSAPFEPQGRCQEAFCQPKDNPAKSQASRSSKDGIAENGQAKTSS